jgi:hypothetical protein
MVEAKSVILTDLFSDKFLPPPPPSDSLPNELQHFSSKEEKMLMGKAHRESKWSTVFVLLFSCNVRRGN